MNKEVVRATGANTDHDTSVSIFWYVSHCNRLFFFTKKTHVRIFHLISFTEDLFFFEIAKQYYKVTLYLTVYFLCNMLFSVLYTPRKKIMHFPPWFTMSHRAIGFPTYDRNKHSYVIFDHKNRQKERRRYYGSTHTASNRIEINSIPCIRQKKHRRERKRTTIKESLNQKHPIVSKNTPLIW